MSRTAACVISLVLGLPILAMVAVAAAGGFDPRLLTTFLVVGVVMAFVVGAIFEIKRLLDSEERDTSEAPAGHGRPHTISVVDAPVASATEAAATSARENAFADQPAPAAIAAPAEPIIVEPVPPIEAAKVEAAPIEASPIEAPQIEAAPVPVEAKTPAKAGRAKRVSVSNAAPEQGVAAAKPKRKGSRSKQPTPA
jgi:hypothetical protein